MSKSIFCIVSRECLQAILRDLKVAGFQQDQISVLMADTRAPGGAADETESKAREGAVKGGVSGAAVGGVLGWLAGIGTLAVPELGPVIAAGPLVAALAGATVGGTLGGIAGAGLGIPEAAAKDYEGQVRSGNVLLSVHSADDCQIDRARELFKQAGAKDISTWGEVPVPELTDSCVTELL